jgi:hypothetical protein
MIDITDPADGNIYDKIPCNYYTEYQRYCNITSDAQVGVTLLGKDHSILPVLRTFGG